MAWEENEARNEGRWRKGRLGWRKDGSVNKVQKVRAYMPFFLILSIHHGETVPSAVRYTHPLQPPNKNQNMVSNTKLFVLGFLCATAIVLGSGIVTLTLVLHKRKE